MAIQFHRFGQINLWTPMFLFVDSDSSRIPWPHPHHLLLMCPIRLKTMRTGPPTPLTLMWTWASLGQHTRFIRFTTQMVALPSSTNTIKCLTKKEFSGGIILLLLLLYYEYMIDMCKLCDFVCVLSKLTRNQNYTHF